MSFTAPVNLGREGESALSQGGDFKAKSGRTPRAILLPGPVSRQNSPDFFLDFCNCDCGCQFPYFKNVLIFPRGRERVEMIFLMGRYSKQQWDGSKRVSLLLQSVCMF